MNQQLWCGQPGRLQQVWSRTKEHLPPSHLPGTALHSDASRRESNPRRARARRRKSADGGGEPRGRGGAKEDAAGREAACEEREHEEHSSAHFQNARFGSQGGGWRPCGAGIHISCCYSTDHKRNFLGQCSCESLSRSLHIPEHHPTAPETSLTRRSTAGLFSTAVADTQI